MRPCLAAPQADGISLCCCTCSRQKLAQSCRPAMSELVRFWRYNGSRTSRISVRCDKQATRRRSEMGRMADMLQISQKRRERLISDIGHDPLCS